MLDNSCRPKVIYKIYSATFPPCPFFISPQAVFVCCFSSSILALM